MRSNSNDRKKVPTPDELAAHREAVDAQAQEVLSHLYQAVLNTPEFTLSNGTKCKVEPFYAPEADTEGDLKCGIDVRMDDGTHLEFTTARTGWGKSFVKAGKTLGKPKHKER